MGFDNIQKKFNDIFAEIGGGTADTGIVDEPIIFDRSSNYA
jgi:chromosome segregation ATPase